MTENEEKAAFAALLLKEEDSFKAAQLLFKDDVSKALRASHFWPKDEFVIAEQKRLLEENGDEFILPSKVQFCRLLEKRMEGTVTPSGLVIPLQPDEFVKLAKLYADVRGFVQKPEANSQTLNLVMPGVIEAPNVNQSNDDWEKEAFKQQQELLNVSASKH